MDIVSFTLINISRYDLSQHCTRKEKAAISRGKPPTRPLLPLLTEQSHEPPSTGTSPILEGIRTQFPSCSPPRSLSTTSFATADHQQSFHQYLNTTSRFLPGLFQSPLWSTLIPQLSHAAPFVKSALIAIGALSKCGRKLNSETPASNGISVTPLYRFALSQYGVAVREMRDTLVLGEEGLRKTLIACLLVVCFEGLQGNYFQALAHCMSGHALVRDWLRGKRTSLTRAKEGLASPAPDVIEDELIHAFQRLDVQIMSYSDARPAAVHAELRSEGAETIRNMPTHFTSIPQARLFLELIQRRTSHFIGCVATAPMKIALDMGDDDAGEIVEYYCHSEPHFALSANIEPWIKDQCLSHVAELARWSAAFQTLHATLELDSLGRTAAMLLDLQARMARIVLLVSIPNNASLSIDVFTPTFRKIIEQATHVSRHPLFSEQDLFSFDVGIVQMGWLVAKWCREPKVRRDAIQLLRGSRLREGMWDALIMAATAEWIMGVEEEGMDENEVIPESERVRITGIKIEYWRRKADVRCVKIGGGEERVAVIEW